MASLSEIVAFAFGFLLVAIVWFVSEHDDRRQYRIGYMDGYNDGLKEHK